MRSRWFTVAASIALLGVVVAGVYLLRRSTAAQARSAQRPAAPAVYTGPEVTLEGPIRATAVTTVPVPIEGRVEQFAVEVGDEVYEGQLIAQVRNQGMDVAREKAQADLEQIQNRVNNLESALVSARLEASRADADASRSRSEHERTLKVYERQRMLLSEGATPRLTYEKAEREYKSASSEYEGLRTLAENAQSRAEKVQNDLDAARKSLDEKQKEFDEVHAEASAGEVHSPVTGVVVARRGTVGDEVNRSMTDLFQIATDTSHLEVTLEPPPPILARIRASQNAAVQIAENAGEPMGGVVKSVAEGKVVVEFANPNPLVKPGMTAHVRILLDASPTGQQPASTAVPR